MRKTSNWWRTIKQARARWAEVDGDQRAAAFAYYLLLSVLPLTILLVTAGSLLVEREVATQTVVMLGMCVCAAQAKVREQPNRPPDKTRESFPQTHEPAENDHASPDL